MAERERARYHTLRDQTAGREYWTANADRGHDKPTRSDRRKFRLPTGAAGTPSNLIEVQVVGPAKAVAVALTNTMARTALGSGGTRALS